jgi:flagellar biosynthetic protein FliO
LLISYQQFVWLDFVRYGESVEPYLGFIMTLNRKKLISLGVIVLTGSFFITCLSAPAADQKASPAPSQVVQSSKDSNYPFITGDRLNTGELFYKMTFAVLLVIVLAIGAAYFSKKLLPKIARFPSKQIKIIETVSLGQHRNLYLVDVAGKKLLIGGTNESINRLADLSDPMADISEPG